MSSLGLSAKVLVNGMMRKLGYQITKCAAAPSRLANGFPVDFEESDKFIWNAVNPYTMTGPERVYSLSRAIEYIVRAGIPGDIVECGVWKGGSSMGLALALLRMEDTSREMYLYDTYDEGWPAGGPDDVTITGVTAHQLWLDAVKRGETADTLFAKYGDVISVMKSTGYPFEKIHTVKGKVEDTIPGTVPEKIALLRLDTDWYASTKHELDHLYPRLAEGGVLMIDDYAAFQGARKAVDEYFEEHNIIMLLNRVDDGGYRIGVKPLSRV